MRRRFAEEGLADGLAFFGRDHSAVVRKVSSRMIFGTMLALIGLFLSLGMLIFRTTCDLRHNLGMYTIQNGTRHMCKNPNEAQHLDSWDQIQVGINGKALEMKYYPTCSTDADCEDFISSPTFCVGGPGDDGVLEEGYCERTGDCHCHSMIFDCGFHHEAPFHFRLSEFSTSCTVATPQANGNLCTDDKVIYVPAWATTKGRLPFGCQAARRTTVKDVILQMQDFMQTNGVFGYLRPEGDQVWNGLREFLDRVPDIETGKFWPSTISESVSAMSDPEAKIFLGFMLTASICLFASDYVNNISTVDMPNKQISFFGLVSIQWNTLRWLLVPMGLILLSEVPMKPTSQIFNIVDLIMTGVHLTGAQFCFVVYLLCEAMALYDEDNRKDMTTREWKVRVVLLAVGAVSMATFGIVYSILFFFSGGETNPFVRPPFVGRSDLYETNKVEGAAFLSRAAEGQWQNLKVISYISEYLVALSILTSHVVIWKNFDNLIRKQGAYGPEEQEAMDSAGEEESE